MEKAKQLDLLIKELSPTREFPSDVDEKWRIFRALVNMREPKPVSSEFMTVQDDFLQSEIKSKGITDIDRLTPVKNNIYLWRGDITTLKVGAIVNAANSAMLGCFSPRECRHVKRNTLKLQ